MNPETNNIHAVIIKVIKRNPKINNNNPIKTTAGHALSWIAEEDVYDIHVVVNLTTKWQSAHFRPGF